MYRPIICTLLYYIAIQYIATKRNLQVASYSYILQAGCHAAAAMQNFQNVNLFILFKRISHDKFHSSSQPLLLQLYTSKTQDNKDFSMKQPYSQIKVTLYANCIFLGQVISYTIQLASQLIYKHCSYIAIQLLIKLFCMQCRMIKALALFSQLYYIVAILADMSIYKI